MLMSQAPYPPRLHTNTPRRLMNYIAIDFESYYSKTYSIAGSSTYQYIKHPEFDPYLVSLWNPNIEYVGRTKEYPDWKALEGFTFIAHNASFDQRVFEECVALGIIPDIKVYWICTADMCVYFQNQRNLKGAASELLSVDMNKEVRSNMKGKTWEDMIAMDESEAVLQYALDDAKYCYQIWEKLYDQWPETERRISRMTRAMAYRGLPVSTAKIEAGVNLLEKAVFEAKKALPWYKEIDPDTRKEYATYSKKAMAIECRKAGVEPPKSLAKGNPDLEEWLAKYGTKLNFVAAMQRFTRANKHLKNLKQMQARITSEERMSYNMKYWGADVTGRWSGESGFNVQNMPRETQYGVNLRNCITAPEGKTFIVADLSQIEPRLTAYLAGDKEFLKLLSEGMSPYEAHARQTMGWTGGKLKDEDPELYMLAKVRVLQLGYGSGWLKFAETVAAYGQTQILDLPFSKSDEVRFEKFATAYQPGKANIYRTLPKEERRQWVNAYIQVQDFRDKNTKITDLWRLRGDELKEAAKGEGDYEVELPSGRSIKYFRCRFEQDGVSVATQRGSFRRVKSYGANIFQNSVQGLARDCFANCLLNLEDRGFKVVLHVHDEVVVEVDEEFSAAALQDVRELMTKPPEWLKGVPLDCEAIRTKEYLK